MGIYLLPKMSQDANLSTGCCKPNNNRRHTDKSGEEEPIAPRIRSDNTHLFRSAYPLRRLNPLLLGKEFAQISLRLHRPVVSLDRAIDGGHPEDATSDAQLTRLCRFLPWCACGWQVDEDAGKDCAMWESSFLVCHCVLCIVVA